MKITRRQTLHYGLGALVAAGFGLGTSKAWGSQEDADKLIKAFTSGQMTKSDGITLTVPEIAENGNTVPISVAVDSPMTDGSYVEAIRIVSEGNPRPGVATFHFSSMSGEAFAKTRIRLAKSQNIVAVAKMSDGSFLATSQPVKVTIGGCGG